VVLPRQLARHSDVFVKSARHAVTNLCDQNSCQFHPDVTARPAGAPTVTRAEAGTLDRIVYRTTILAFPVFGLGVIFGRSGPRGKQARRSSSAGRATTPALLCAAREPPARQVKYWFWTIGPRSDGKFVHVWLHAGGEADEGRLHAIWSVADDHLIGIVADVGSDACRVLRDEELDQFL
jgi:hypothetical protein